jgi:hypothetical protein
MRKMAVTGIVIGLIAVTAMSILVIAQIRAEERI